MQRPGAYLLVTGAVILVGVAVRLFDPAPVSALRSVVFETFEKLSPRDPLPRQPVTFISVDAESQARYGSLPWTQPRLAALLEAVTASHAAAIGLAVPLPQAPPPTLDQLLESLPAERRRVLAPLAAPLRRALANDRQSGGARARLGNILTRAPVVLGVRPEVQAGPPPTPARLIGLTSTLTQHWPALPAHAAPPPSAASAIIANAVSTVGLVDHVDDRHIPGFYRRGDNVFPSLAVALLGRAQGVTGYDLTPHRHLLPRLGIDGIAARLRVGDVVVPLDGRGTMRLEAASRTSFETVPAWRVLEGLAGNREIDGRIVVIGTPQIGAPQAQAVAQMLGGAQTHRPGYGAALEIVVMVSAGVLAAFLVFVIGPLQGALIATTLAAGFAFLAWLTFESSGLLLDPLYPALGIFATFAAVAALRNIFNRAERGVLRSYFRSRTAPGIVEDVTRLPADKFLRPRRRELTVLAARLHGLPDIEGDGGPRRFARAAQQMAHIMVDTTISCQGTVEHFDGATLLAFWNAPVRDEDHHYHACLAVLEITQALHAFNSRMAQTAQKKGHKFRPITLTAGIDSQPGVLGNLTLTTPAEYRVFCPARESAQDLAQTASKIGLGCLLSAETVRAVPDLALLEAIAPFPPLAASVGEPPNYILLGDDVMQRSETFRRLRLNHERMLTALRARDFPEAERLLKTCHILGGAALADYYRRLATVLSSHDTTSHAA